MYMESVAIEFIKEMQSALLLLRLEEIEAGVELLRRARNDRRTIFVCGNGGSAATASRLAAALSLPTDDGGAGLRAAALTDNVTRLTALAEDSRYDDAFVEPLRSVIDPDDLIVGISPTGDCENIVRAFELAKDRDAKTLALIGFDGGRLGHLASARIWIDSRDAAIVESAHVFVAHLLVRRLRQEIDVAHVTPTGSHRLRHGVASSRTRPAADIVWGTHEPTVAADIIGVGL